MLEELVLESGRQAEHYSFTPGESAPDSPRASCRPYVCGFSPSLQHKALVDSGAAGNFMDHGLALRLGIPLVSLDQPFPVHSLDSRPLGSGLVREATVPLDMVTQRGGHKEWISLFLIDSPAFPVVLGIPWIAHHNPVITRRQGALRGSEECSGRCIGVSVGATTVESPDQVSAVRIPSEYADLAIAFCKKKATQLPPHRRGDWDCALNLLENAALPRSHVYPLSQEETVAMETYVAESLGQGYIRPSPVSSSFFFCEEEGWRSASVH